MIIRLFHRHYGQHSFIKECKVEGSITRYVKKLNYHTEVGRYEPEINEDKLIQAIPNNFLPSGKKGINKILLTIQDKRHKGISTGSTGIYNIEKFKSWGKYFDSYCLELTREN